jgi:hypothetical protein
LEHFGKIRKILSPIPCFSSVADDPDRCLSDRRWRIDVKTKTIAQMLMVSGFAACLWNSHGFAAGGVHCQEVGGTILTNFLPPVNCPESAQNLCTDGTATGDLKGAVGARILSISGNVFHVLHHWVTESGDTIFLNEADATNYSTSDPNHVLAVYLNGIGIAGGTGRFEGATGTIFSFGAADLTLGHGIFRYSGTVCFPMVKE